LGGGGGQDGQQESGGQEHLFHGKAEANDESRFVA
jgi:hypothetical protein